MGFMIKKEVGGVAFHVRRLTVREIYDLFSWAADPVGSAEAPDWIGTVLFEDVTVRDILTFTDLTRDQLLEMMPADVETVIVEMKRENPHFFAACRRLEEAGKRLNAVMGGKAQNDSSKASSP